MLVAVGSHENVVTAVLGAAAGLAGLTLVFLGLIVSDYQGRAASFTDEGRTRYARLAALVLFAFATSMACVAVATAWLLGSHNVEALYVVVVVTFFASLVILLAVTLVVVHRLLARHA